MLSDADADADADNDADADAAVGDGAPVTAAPVTAAPVTAALPVMVRRDLWRWHGHDCSMACVSRSSATAYVGDGYCDDGTSGMDLMCEEFGFDGGDCAGGSGADADNDGTMPDEGSSGGAALTAGVPAGVPAHAATTAAPEWSTTAPWRARSLHRDRLRRDGYCDDGTFGVDLML